ncbi:hypothetical protein ACFQQB_22495 [Nonomuraea rubra]|uniref:hypothetical protein n=1 Tax=Nonomuraea rubra TaxID=46180 RepID=UPI00360B846E
MAGTTTTGGPTTTTGGPTTPAPAPGEQPEVPRQPDAPSTAPSSGRLNDDDMREIDALVSDEPPQHRKPPNG